VILVAELVIEWRFRVGKDVRHLHTTGGIPVPERQSKSWVINKFAQDSFIEVKMVTVPRKEEPTGMNINF